MGQEERGGGEGPGHLSLPEERLSLGLASGAPLPLPPPSSVQPLLRMSPDWAPGLNPNTSRDNCLRPTQSLLRPLLKGPGEAERILGAETIAGLE